MSKDSAKRFNEYVKEVEQGLKKELVYRGLDKDKELVKKVEKAQEGCKEISKHVEKALEK